MKMIKWLAALGCVITLAGCAVIFGRSTDDPAVKLQWASELFSSKDEPVEAEKLLHEAEEMYEEKSDQLGLAETYREYGLFYRSNAVTKFKKHYREDEGFLDRTVKFDKRYDKAVEYFNRSKDIYSDYGRIDKLADIYISLAKTYDMMDKQKEACDAFTQGLEKFAAYKQASPEAEELRSEELANYEEYIGIMKKQSGCP